MTTSTPVLPVQQTERIQIVDILRGFALFGILFVNMTIFSHPMQAIVMPTDPSLPWHDRAAIWLIHALGEGKFYALFSMLFGLGLFLQMERVEGRGGRFVPLYARRLLVLLGIGLVHAFLIWMGDILIVYALIGFLLLLFRKAKPRTLLIWVVLLIAIPVLFNAAITALVTWASTIPEAAPQIEQSFAQAEAEYAADLERAAQVYATGNFAEITAQRVKDYFDIGLAGVFVMGFNILAMFLLGLYFGKREVFKNLEAHRGLFVRLLVIGLALGLSGNLLYATLIMPISRIYQSWTLFLATTAQTIGAPLLMLAYVSAFCLLALHPVWGKRISVLAPVGQMALTNYLTQSIVCTLIFYGYGLGLFGKMGPAAGIGLTIVIYLLQIPLSHWWMKRFQYGPAEWLWRSLTYLKPQPMRRAGGASL
ncbi:MAG: DUF418 domain-containing protein [Anaerolineales bacterium]|nr:DUF418 domain-containing protein [Anaerolineales bacterium]